MFGGHGEISFRQACCLALDFQNTCHKGLPAGFGSIVIAVVATNGSTSYRRRSSKHAGCLIVTTGTPLFTWGVHHQSERSKARLVQLAAEYDSYPGNKHPRTFDLNTRLLYRRSLYIVVVSNFYRPPKGHGSHSTGPTGSVYQCRNNRRTNAPIP